MCTQRAGPGSLQEVDLPLGLPSRRPARPAPTALTVQPVQPPQLVLRQRLPAAQRGVQVHERPAVLRVHQAQRVADLVGRHVHQVGEPDACGARGSAPRAPAQPSLLCRPWPAGAAPVEPPSAQPWEDKNVPEAVSSVPRNAAPALSSRQQGGGGGAAQGSWNPGLWPPPSLPLPAYLTPNRSLHPQSPPAVPALVKGPRRSPGHHLSSSCSAWGPGPSTRCRQSGCRRAGGRRRAPARPSGHRSSGALRTPGSPCG